METLRDTLPRTAPMPVLFLGHGSPMNAIEDNVFTRSLRDLGMTLPRPAAVAVVSAHWLTRGSHVLCATRPRTVHDFYGFPPELYAVEYPAPGGMDAARTTAEVLGAACDSAWGLDHASWAVLRHVFPDADVPVFEISIDAREHPLDHVELARRLAPLRERGVMIVGSGNIVHNLGAIRWEDDARPFDWALEFDEWVRDRLLEGDLASLADYEKLGRVAELSVPTNDHYLPMLYAAALRRADETVRFTHESVDMGSVSMRCAVIG